jgi:hypothetical protein
VLIGYDDERVATVATTSSTPTCNYVESLLELFFRCSAHLVIMIHDLLLANFLG